MAIGVAWRSKGGTSLADDGRKHYAAIGWQCTKYKVRLDRIDAPEKDQPYGKESTAYLSSLIRGKTIRVEWQKKDKYGRVLGIVFLDKADINLNLVATGNAWHYSYFDNTPAYAAAEATAKEKKLGLWGEENPICPCD